LYFQSYKFSDFFAWMQLVYTELKIIVYHPEKQVTGKFIVFYNYPYQRISDQAEVITT